MSNKTFYEKYYSKEIDENSHVNNPPTWPVNELENFYRSIAPYVGKNILDIGAGEGAFLEYLQKQRQTGLNITALEISEIAAARGRIRNPDVNYYVGSADNAYPFVDEQFDTIFMTDVIEHIIDIDQTVEECYRVLIKGGKLIIITPVFNWIKKMVIAAFFWEKFFHPTNPHIRFFTKKSMDSLMIRHGLKKNYYKWGLTWLKLMPQNAFFVYEKK